MEQNCAAWLEQVLVDKTEHVDIVLWAGVGRNDGVVVVDDLFDGTDGHHRTAELLELCLGLLQTRGKEKKKNEFVRIQHCARIPSPKKVFLHPIRSQSDT